MPLIDLRCADETCDTLRLDYPRPLADWPDTPPCETCGGPTEQAHLPPRTRWTVDPVVVYKAPDGTFRFPGDTDGSGSAKYHQMGYERVELRSAADVRRFEAGVPGVRGTD